MAVHFMDSGFSNQEVYALWLNTPGMGLNNLDDSKQGIKRYLKRNPKTCFIATEKSKVIGVILCGHDGRRGYIHHTSVELSHRNKGIGTDLVNHEIKALKSEQIHKVAFVVFKNNEIGNYFWERNGFQKREDLNYRNKVISDGALQWIDT